MSPDVLLLLLGHYLLHELLVPDDLTVITYVYTIPYHVLHLEKVWFDNRHLGFQGPRIL